MMKTIIIIFLIAVIVFVGFNYIDKAEAADMVETVTEYIEVPVTQYEIVEVETIKEVERVIDHYITENIYVDADLRQLVCDLNEQKIIRRRNDEE